MSNRDINIIDLVAQNTDYAAVLHFFGISFYLFPNERLEKVCKLKNLDLEMVLKSLNNASYRQNNQDRKALQNLPIEVILTFLKKSHKSFIRHQLPFINDMVINIEPHFFDDPDIAKDLKFIFPLFAEDFIHHIYEEEKTHFGYIENLKRYQDENTSPYFYYKELIENSIADILEHHKEEDDEMLGIRELTNNYEVNEKSGIYTKTVYMELKKFEESLCKHAYIENEILFPKAMEIEEQLSSKLKHYAQLN